MNPVLGLQLYQVSQIVNSTLHKPNNTYDQNHNVVNALTIKQSPLQAVDTSQVKTITTE